MYLPKHNRCPTCGECPQCRTNIWDMGARVGAAVGGIIGLLAGSLITIILTRFVA